MDPLYREHNSCRQTKANVLQGHKGWNLLQFNVGNNFHTPTSYIIADGCTNGTGTKLTDSSAIQCQKDPKE